MALLPTSPQHSHQIPSYGPYWSPQSPGAPVFQPYRPVDTVVRALTRTQVALQEQRSIHSALVIAQQSAEQKWSKQRSAMQAKMHHLQIKCDEVDRHFKEQLSTLQATVQQSEAAMAVLVQEHHELQDSSEQTVRELQQRAASLQAMCQTMETQRKAIEAQLETATLSASEGKVAEARCVALAADIAVLREHAATIIGDLTRQRDEIQAIAQQKQRDVEAGEARLQQEQQVGQHHRSVAAQLAVERQRLAAALEVEMIINEPLRHTTHATTTMSRIMRSPVAEQVAGKSRTPVTPTYATKPIPFETKRLDDDLITIRRPLMSQSFASKTLTRLSRAYATLSPLAGEMGPVFQAPGSPTGGRHSRTASAPRVGMASRDYEAVQVARARQEVERASSAPTVLTAQFSPSSTGRPATATQGGVGVRPPVRTPTPSPLQPTSVDPTSAFHAVTAVARGEAVHEVSSPRSVSSRASSQAQGEPGGGERRGPRVKGGASTPPGMSSPARTASTLVYRGVRR